MTYLIILFALQCDRTTIETTGLKSGPICFGSDARLRKGKSQYFRVIVHNAEISLMASCGSFTFLLACVQPSPISRGRGSVSFPHEK